MRMASFSEGTSGSNTITKVELLGALTPGATPATWWKSKSGDEALEAQLALLSWVPEATPKAVGSSKYLDETVKQTWGTSATPPLPPLRCSTPSSSSRSAPPTSAGPSPACLGPTRRTPCVPAPRRVDPWILVAPPGEGEQHVFAGEPIRIVFATNNLAKIFDAYGKKLQARVKAASFRPVPSTPSVPHPFPLTEAHLQPVAATILSPWEGAIKSLAAANPCIASSGSTVRHTMVTMAIPLDLDTDYVIDIEMLDKLAADGTAGERVWRGSFTTGHFLTLDLFAKSFRTARLTHRGVATANVGGLQAIGVTFATHSPEGSEFDNALITAGLDAQPVPKAPRMIVFWDATLPQPQPAAILIDSSEPMWRSRLIPTQVIDAGPAASKRYDMVSQPWLDLRQQPGGDDIVDKIVPAPGGQRALVTLKPNSRGKHLRLALCRIHHPEPYLDGPASTDQLVNLLDYTLGNAPWEEVD